MIEISYATLIGFFSFAALIGPALLYVGRVSKQVDVNKDNIATIFNKIETIHEYVKNGPKP